jgi:hypothetical protein
MAVYQGTMTFCVILQRFNDGVSGKMYCLLVFLVLVFTGYLESRIYVCLGMSSNISGAYCHF